MDTDEPRIENERDFFVRALDDGNVDLFLEFIERSKSKYNDAFDLRETIETLSQNELAYLFTSIWNILQPLLDVKVAEILSERQHQLDQRDEDEPIEEEISHVDKKDMDFISGVMIVVNEFLKDKERVACEALNFIVVRFHDFIIPFQMTEYPTTADMIVSICENWWIQQRPMKDSIAPQTISFLLLRALNFNRPAEVGRLYRLRSMFSLMDFSDESSDSLKTLLIRAMIHPLFLQHKDGPSLLVSWFGLDETLINQLHSAIKYQLSESSKPILSIYGNIYWKAWSSSSHTLKIEECLQDLMKLGMLGRDPKVTSGVFRVLSEIHSNRNAPSVDAMLLRLYEPILWRHLKVAHPLVRKNASMLFFDAFPLNDNQSNQRETDENMQRQFSLLEDLLMDKSVGVRVSAVKGVARIIGVYWELIPDGTIRHLLSIIFDDLAFDTNVPVRSACIESFSFLLDYHLAKDLLGQLLPTIGVLVHDKSEHVRSLVLKLLLKMKSLKLKYHEVVSVRNLLLRLPIENEKNAATITYLLINSYFTGGSADEQIQRCLQISKENFKSALAFYTESVKEREGKIWIDLQEMEEKLFPDKSENERLVGITGSLVRSGSSCKLIIYLIKYILKLSETRKNQNGKRPKPDNVSYWDEEMATKILKIAGSMWLHVYSDLGTDTLKEKMNALLSDEKLLRLREIFSRNGDAERILFQIASTFPQSKMPKMFAIVEQNFKTQLESANEEEIMDWISCLLKWKSQNMVLEVTVHYLSQISSKSSSPSDFEIPLKLLKSLSTEMVAWKGMKKIVEAGNGKNVRDLIDSLVSFLPLLCAHFSRPDSKSLNTMKALFLEHVVGIYGRLVIHFSFGSAPATIPEKDSELVKDYLEWVRDSFLPLATKLQKVEISNEETKRFFVDVLEHVSQCVCDLVCLELCTSKSTKSLIDSTLLPILSNSLLLEAHSSSPASKLLMHLYLQKHSNSAFKLLEGMSIKLDGVTDEKTELKLGGLFAFHNLHLTLDTFVNQLTHILFKNIEIPSDFSSVSLRRKLSQWKGSSSSLILQAISKSSFGERALLRFLQEQLFLAENQENEEEEEEKEKEIENEEEEKEISKKGNQEIQNEIIWKSLQITSGLRNLHENRQEIDPTAHSLLDGIKRNLLQRNSENVKQLRRKTNELLALI